MTGLIYLAGTFIYGWFIGYSQSQRLLDDELAENNIYLKSIAIPLLNNLSKNDISSVEHILHEYMRLNDFKKLTIVNKNNRILTELVSQQNEIINTYNYGQSFQPVDDGEYDKQLSVDLNFSARELGVLYAHVDFSHIKTLRNEIRATIFLAGVLIYLIILIITIINLRMILQPLSKTAEFTRNMVSNMGSTVEVDTNISEINDLVQAVNWSSAKLKNLNEELRVQAEQLENEVLIRTKELSLSKKKAESASEEKTRFLSHMSHELRTPLNSILGFSQILTMKPESMTVAQIENVKEINKSGNHLLSLVNELLDISKIEEGALDVHLAKINAVSFFSKFYNSTKKLAADSDISMDSKLRIASTVCMNVDEKRLTQIMYNLVSNAIKYTNKSGSIIITVSEEDRLVKVEVSDTGIGIENKDFDKVFDKFTRFDSVNYTEGAGIGLHLTRELVELMGGEIDFSSEYGVGSKFWFTIPENNNP